VLLPDQAARGRFDHLRTFSAAIPATAVHEALAVWRAGDAPAVTGDGSGAALQALLTHLGTTAAAFPGVLDQPLIRASAQQALVQALIASSAGIADGGRSEYATSRALRRALAFMEEHAAEPITVPAIAAEARMSVRGMQAMFQRELGMTPAARLRRIRLDRARSELLAAEPHDGVSVATVAHRWGFAHLSRFAAVYREAFGEPPSRTLRR
jgi:transcriptional regulator GlxA family with amidase domain